MPKVFLPFMFVLFAVIKNTVLYLTCPIIIGQVYIVVRFRQRYDVVWFAARGHMATANSSTTDSIIHMGLYVRFMHT